MVPDERQTLTVPTRNHLTRLTLSLVQPLPRVPWLVTRLQDRFAKPEGDHWTTRSPSLIAYRRGIMAGSRGVQLLRDRTRTGESSAGRGPPG